MSVTRPSSTAGSSASCWALLKRWISSRKKTVGSASRRRCWARSSTLRTSARPASTALSSSRAAWRRGRTIRASVVFPEPGARRGSSSAAGPARWRSRSAEPRPAGAPGRRPRPATGVAGARPAGAPRHRRQNAWARPRRRRRASSWRHILPRAPVDYVLFMLWCFTVAVAGGLVGLVLGNIRLPFTLLIASSVAAATGANLLISAAAAGGGDRPHPRRADQLAAVRVDGAPVDRGRASSAATCRACCRARRCSA